MESIWDVELDIITREMERKISDRALIMFRRWIYCQCVEKGRGMSFLATCFGCYIVAADIVIAISAIIES